MNLRRSLKVQFIFGVVVAAMLHGSMIHAGELVISHPQSRQVHQRIGSAPGVGYAVVAVAGTCDVSAKLITWEYQLKADDSSGGATSWQEFSNTATESGKFAGQIRIPAGWWQLFVRCRDDQTELASGHQTYIGVGEVFVVAGQSYATNTNDERLNVTDAGQRVSAFDLATGTWRLANDPQPTPDGSDGGSIWAPIGDMLVAELKVPVGFANVAVVEHRRSSGCRMGRCFLDLPKSARRSDAAVRSCGNRASPM